MKTLHAVCVPGDCGPEDTARADRIVQRMTGLSRADVRGLFDHGCVMVNDSPCVQPQMAVDLDAAVRVHYDPHRRYKEQNHTKDDPAFELLFEDEAVIVVNKSPHVFTVPTPTDKGKTLVDALERHVTGGRVANRRGPQRSLHIVQRLDRGVSGVLVVAKSARAAEHLKEQFAAHKPKREYIAIVSGLIEQKRSTFRSHMATGRTLDRYSTNKPGKGELAVTHYEVIAQAQGCTAARVHLETGRRNQIRVHFAEAGHPILGDKRYGKDQSSHPRWKAKRLALHARTLEFMHPATGKIMRFEAELPLEFGPFMQRTRR